MIQRIFLLLIFRDPLFAFFSIYLRKTWVVALTSNLGFLESINLTKGNQLQTIKYPKFELCSFHKSIGIVFIFLCETI